MENIEKKNKVGRPKGSKKENKKIKSYAVKCMLNDIEETKILTVFKIMGLNKEKRGANKKMFFDLIEFYLNNQKK